MISASSRKMRDGRAKPDFLQSGLADHLANWFIPTSMRLDPDARRRALLFLISHLLGPWLGLAIVGYLYWLDSRPAPLLLPAIAIAAFWLFPLALRLSGRFALLALLSVQNLAFVVLFISYHYGGLSSPFLPWLVTIPMLAFFYLGDDKRMRCIALIGLVADLAVFYLAYRINGSFPNRLPLQSLSSVGLVSVFCAGLYVTIMASYYGRIVVSRSELQREILRHKQTAIMLVEARDTAEDANRAKSSFLANMSHELRTPLNAVIGFSEIMRNELFGSLGHQNYKDYANDIHASGSHLLQVINDILDISKADSGTLELRECVINCRDLLAECRRYVRPRLRKAELTLTSNLPNSLPRLRADPRMVKQIVLNLLTNAVKFTQPGGHIEIEASADRYRGFTITIRDTGIGITKTDLGRVREPFVQVEPAARRNRAGFVAGGDDDAPARRRLGDR